MLLGYEMEGESMGDLVTCDDVSQVDREQTRGVVTNHYKHKLCIDQPQVYRTMSCIDAVFQMLQFQVLGQDITSRISRFFVGHHPPHIYPHVYLKSCI